MLCFIDCPVQFQAHLSFPANDPLAPGLSWPHSATASRCLAFDMNDLISVLLGLDRLQTIEKIKGVGKEDFRHLVFLPY